MMLNGRQIDYALFEEDINAPSHRITVNDGGECILWQCLYILQSNSKNANTIKIYDWFNLEELRRFLDVLNGISEDISRRLAFLKCRYF